MTLDSSVILKRKEVSTMTIDQAIKTLSDSANSGSTTFDENYKSAQRLGIEALKSVRTGREVGLHYEGKCLLGETII